MVAQSEADADCYHSTVKIKLATGMTYLVAASFECCFPNECLALAEIGRLFFVRQSQIPLGTNEPSNTFSDR